MGAMEPLERELVEAVSGGFSGRNAWRDKMVWWLGYFTGYRVSELLQMRVKDVFDGDGVRQRVGVSARAMKTRERREVLLMEECREMLAGYRKELLSRGFCALDGPLFPKDLGYYRRAAVRAAEAFGRGDCKDRFAGCFLGRAAFYRSVKRAAVRAGLSGAAIGTHTMRKSFAWRVYQHCLSRPGVVDPVVQSMRLTGHSSPVAFLRYLAVDKKRDEEVLCDAFRA